MTTEPRDAAQPAPAAPPEEPQHGVVTPGEDEVQQPDKHERPAQE